MSFRVGTDTTWVLLVVLLVLGGIVGAPVRAAPVDRANAAGQAPPAEQTTPARVASPADSASEAVERTPSTVDRTAVQSRSFQPASNEALEEAAREGVNVAAQHLGQRGVTLTPEQRQLAVDTAVRSVPFVESFDFSSFRSPDTPSGSVTGEPEVTPEVLRAAVAGAVFGAFVPSAASPNAAYTETAIFGGIVGAAVGGPAMHGQGGEIAPVQVRAAAQGGAEGTIRELATLPASAVDTNDVLSAAVGATAGAAMVAGTLPIYAESAAPLQVYSAAYGSSGGAVRGAYEDARRNPDFPRNASRTMMAAGGASGGVLAGLLYNSTVGIEKIRALSHDIAFRAVTDPEIETGEQVIEAAFTTTLNEFTPDRPFNPLFPTPIRPGGGTASFFSITFWPRDPDGDGLYEDVNGNGVLLYSDVVAMLAIQSTVSLAPSQERALDFNGDCVFDDRDAWALDNEITGGPYEDGGPPPVTGTNASSTPCSNAGERATP